MGLLKRGRGLPRPSSREAALRVVSALMASGIALALTTGRAAAQELTGPSALARIDPGLLRRNDPPEGLTARR